MATSTKNLTSGTPGGTPEKRKAAKRSLRNATVKKRLKALQDHIKQAEAANAALKVANKKHLDTIKDMNDKVEILDKRIESSAEAYDKLVKDRKHDIAAKDDEIKSLKAELKKANEAKA
jgi:chromosome segregation ATPase